MSDDKTKTGGQDRERVNVNEDYELRDWAKSLNTTPDKLKEAVRAVGYTTPSNIMTSTWSPTAMSPCA